MNLTSFLLVILVVCAGLSNKLIAQQKADPDLTVPGEEHEKLKVLAGNWDVIVRFPTEPGMTMEGRSACEAKWVLDGRFLRQEYSSILAGRPLSVVRYLGFDRHRGRVVELQLESTHTDVMHNEGTISADGKTITSVGQAIDLMSGKEVKVRSVTKILDNDSFTLHLTYAGSTPNDAKTVTLIHKRKKPN